MYYVPPWHPSTQTILYGSESWFGADGESGPIPLVLVSRRNGATWGVDIGLFWSWGSGRAEASIYDGGWSVDFGLVVLANSTGGTRDCSCRSAS